MKIDDRKRFIKRILMTVFGVLVLGVAVGFLDYSDFGLDPFQTFAHGIGLHVPLQYGTTYMIISIIEIIVIFFVDKKKIGLGTLINLFLLGYVVDYSSKVIKVMFDSLGGGMVFRIISMVIGVVVLCLCAAIYFTADMGVSTHDAVSLIISEKQSKIKYSWLRMINDLLCVLIGFLLGQKFGVGTIISGFFTGPLIAFFRKHVSDPMLNGKEKK